jgi:hypothetical protein
MDAMTVLAEYLKLARQARPDGDAASLADGVLELVLRLHVSDARAALLPAVTEWVAAAERSRVRSREHKTWPPGGKANANPAQDAMRKMLAGTVFVPGQGMVAWGEMTVAFHLLRITYLQRKLDEVVTGTKATIARHELAVSFLNESSCANLNDYADLHGELPAQLAAEPAEASVT